MQNHRYMIAGKPDIGFQIPAKLPPVPKGYKGVFRITRHTTPVPDQYWRSSMHP
jgi:hypothetical protein